MTIHAKPIDDLIDHDDGLECPCGPDVEFLDPETGDTFPDGPYVRHHSLDGREHPWGEWATGRRDG